LFSISNFKDCCQSHRWTTDRYTSEFTLQFRICRLLQSLDSNLVIELESNINRYGLEKFTKKEIDIEYYNNNELHSCLNIFKIK